MVKLRWTGAAGLEFTFDDKTILVDPYYTRISKFNMIFGRVVPDFDLIKKISSEIKGLAAIIVSHTHFDHSTDIPCFASLSDCSVIGSKSLDALMKIHKMPGRSIVCLGKEKIELSDDASVTMHPSLHGRVAFGKVPFQGEISSLTPMPMKAGDYRAGKVFAPEIEIKGKKFLHIGSAGFIEKELEGLNCDVLFLCVPGWRQTKGYPEKIIELTRPETVVLFHFDDFFIKNQAKTKRLRFIGINAMVKRIQKYTPGIRIIIPGLFEKFEF